MKEMLDAPCVFCGYDGADYWQAGSHKDDCPWANVGDCLERSERLRLVVSALFGQRQDQAARIAALEAEREKACVAARAMSNDMEDLRESLEDAIAERDRLRGVLSSVRGYIEITRSYYGAAAKPHLAKIDAAIAATPAPKPDEALRLLRDMEWTGPVREIETRYGRSSARACQFCNRTPDIGHSPNCALGRYLAAHKEG